MEEAIAKYIRKGYVFIHEQNDGTIVLKKKTSSASFHLVYIETDGTIHA